MTSIVWMASYPKSGNTWFRAVLAALSSGSIDLDRLIGPGHGLVASSRERLERELGVPSSTLTPSEIARLRPLVDGAIAASVDEQLLTKIHDNYRTAPGGPPAVSAAATRCAIYFVRDPRDVAVSFANHTGRDLTFTVDAMARADFTIGSSPNDAGPQVGQRLGSWSEHVLGWIDDAPFPVMTVRYEDCLTDPLETFSAALRFVGLEPTDGEVELAVERARFDDLRRLEEQNGFRERPAASERFFRRGESGGWRDELPSELAERIRSDHAPVMARFGYR